MHIPVAPKGSLAPPGRWGSSVTKCGDKVVVIGGICLSSPANGMVWCFNIKTGEWSQPVASGDAPGPRWGHAATLVSPTQILILGGREGSKPVALSEYYVLDTETWCWARHATTTPAPKGRYAFGTTLLSDNRILIFGGHGGRNRFYCDMHVLQFSLVDDQMPLNGDPSLVPFRSAGPSTPSSIATPRTAATPNMLLGGAGMGGADPGTPFSTGGGDSDDESSPIGALAPAPRAPTGIWLTPVTRGMGPVKRTGLSLTRVGTSPYVLLVGGYNGKETLGDLHVLHTGTWTWTQPQPRQPPPPPAGAAPRPFGSYPCVGSPPGPSTGAGLERQPFLLPPASGHMVQLLPGGRYLLISGGALSCTEMSSSSVLLDLRTWSWCAVTPEQPGNPGVPETPRCWHRCVTLTAAEAAPLLPPKAAASATGGEGGAAPAPDAAAPGTTTAAAAVPGEGGAPAPSPPPADEAAESSYLLVFGGCAGPCEALADLYLIDTNALASAAASATEGTPVPGATRGFQSCFALAPSMAVGMGGVGRLPAQSTLLLSPETPAAAAAIVGGGSALQGGGGLLPAKGLGVVGGVMPGLMGMAGSGAGMPGGGGMSSGMGTPASPMMMVGGGSMGGTPLGMGSGSPGSGMGGGSGRRQQQHGQQMGYGHMGGHGQQQGLMQHGMGHHGGMGGGFHVTSPLTASPGHMGGGHLSGGLMGSGGSPSGMGGGARGAMQQAGYEDGYMYPSAAPGGMMGGGMLGVAPSHGMGGGRMSGGGSRGSRGHHQQQHQQHFHQQQQYGGSALMQQQQYMQQQHMMGGGGGGWQSGGYGGSADVSSLPAMQQQQLLLQAQQQQQLARQQRRSASGSSSSSGGGYLHEGMPSMGSGSGGYHGDGSSAMAGMPAGGSGGGWGMGSAAAMSSASAGLPAAGTAVAQAPSAPSSRIPPPIRVPGAASSSGAASSGMLQAGPLLRPAAGMDPSSRFGSGSMHTGGSLHEEGGDGYAPHFDWDPLSRSIRMAPVGVEGSGSRPAGGFPGSGGGMMPAQPAAGMQQQQQHPQRGLQQQLPPSQMLPPHLHASVGGAAVMMGSAAVAGPASAREHRSASFDGPDLTSVLHGLDRLLD